MGQLALFTSAAPIETCALQADCISFSVNKIVTDQICDCNCVYNICMTLSYSGDCVKASDDTVSHTCAKDPASCSDVTGFDTALEVTGLPDGYTTCQQVPAGGTAEFILKDGNARGGCGDAAVSFQSDYTASCETYGIQACTGNGNIGKECIWKIDAPEQCNKRGGCFGDPHIKRWDQKRFDFHGECDLVLLHSDHVNGDVPLDLHVRTTIHGHYSYIESAAMKVGDTVFQLDTDKFFVNGVEFGDSSALSWMFDEFTVEPVQTEGVAKIYTVVLTDLSTIKFKVIKNFISVAVSGHEDDFAKSWGLLGDYYTGDALGRDGRLMGDFVEYGMEWQVNAEEPKLFREDRAPQLPHARCIMPTETSMSRRRLLRNANDMELTASAERVCNTKEDFESCMEDVIATGDIDLAGAW